MIYFIVPTYGRLDLTTRFINSISFLDNFRIILIDDDLSFETSRNFNLIKNIICLKGTGDLWWGGAINMGINYLKNQELDDSDIIVFANNDIEISKESFNNLLYEIESTPNQLVHPRTFNENDVEISSGVKILSWFPYITKHPLNFEEEKYQIDLGNARCLLMTYRNLIQIGSISDKLPHYQGDNDFTLRAKKKGIPTFILRNSSCSIFDGDTGMKNGRIKTFKDLILSFKTIRSPNNIRFRFKFVSNHFNYVLSFFIVLSMSMNSVIHFIMVRKNKDI